MAIGTQKRKNLAIMSDMLSRMRNALDNGFARNQRHTEEAVRCVWAAILIGFFAMLRKDNLTSEKNKNM